MATSFIEIEGIKIPYVRFGSGPKLLIAFPGYGDKKEEFLKLKGALSDAYVLYALDLPGHGESDWPRDQFLKADFENAITAILQIEKKARFSLMGHSFGGRAILSMLPALADSIDEIFLLAPDGLDEGYMRRATFLPKGIRKLFQRFLKNPNWYIGLVTVLNKMGLLKNYSYQFVKLNFAKPRRRKRLFLFWNSIDDFKFDPLAIKKILNTKSILIEIVLGERDYVIPGAAWIAWAEDLKHANVKTLDEDHQLIGAKLNAYLKTPT